MATRQKVSMPNPGWLFFWIFSIILFVFLCFHHGSYDIEDITPLQVSGSVPGRSISSKWKGNDRCGSQGYRAPCGKPETTISSNLKLKKNSSKGNIK
jgi:hypothetical protein